MNNIVNVNNLFKTYSNGNIKVEALRDVSFSVSEGEFIILLGKSGSGKSTLLNLLSGLDKPTSGEILINEKDITKYSQNELAYYRRRDVGLMFQFYNLIPELNIYENIAYPIWLDGKKEDKKYINDIIDKLELGERINHLPDQLSGGQQQRVALARALATKAKLILADEPTGNLDKTSGQIVWDMLKELSKNIGCTVIAVTHDKDMKYLADRCFTIEDGVISEGEHL